MSQTPTQRVADNVRAEAARKRVPQARFAQALGLTQQAVSRRINGQVPFRIDELYVAAEILGTTPAELLGNAGVPA